jgi:hypothetical protein
VCCHNWNPSGAEGGSKVRLPLDSKPGSVTSESETSLLEVSVQASFTSWSESEGMFSGKFSF